MRDILKPFQNIICIMWCYMVNKPSARYLRNIHWDNQISKSLQTKINPYKIGNMYQIGTNSKESNSYSKCYPSSKIMLDSSIGKSNQQNNKKNYPYSFHKIMNLYIRSIAICIFDISSELHLQSRMMDRTIDNLNQINMFPEGKRYNYYMRSMRHSYCHMVGTLYYFRKSPQGTMLGMKRRKGR